MKKQTQKQVIEFEQVVQRGCRMDVHQETVVATVAGVGIKRTGNRSRNQSGSCLKFRRKELKEREANAPKGGFLLADLEIVRV